jgi:hypothetical protein
MSTRPTSTDSAAAEAVEGVRLTRGFVAFLGALLLPAVAAVVIVGAATFVADEVYAAESGGEDVAGWKHTVVGICPIH